VERSCTEVWLRDGLADPVDLGAADRAGAHRCRFAVLHRYRLRVLHLDLSLVLQTVAFHFFTFPFLQLDPNSYATALPIL